MASEFHPVIWAEHHPYIAGAVVFGGGLTLLWLLGFFGPNAGSGDGASGGNANLAGAYYAAEAQQAVIGGQIQQMTLKTAADTAQMGLQTDAAVKIAASQDSTNASIASSMYAADVTKANYAMQTAQTLGAYSADVQKTGLVYGAQTSQVLGAYAAQTAQAHDAYAVQAARDAEHASLLQTIYGVLFPAEIAQTKGWGVVTGPDGQAIYLGAGSGLSMAVGQGPAAMAALGYSPAQFAALSGLPQ